MPWIFMYKPRGEEVQPPSSEYLISGFLYIMEIACRVWSPIMPRIFLILALLLSFAVPASAQKKLKAPGERWSKDKAAKWYKDEPWLVGCNYIPSTAINQLEMWQADSWDPKTIDRELGWAEDLGFTSVRVFLHNLPWHRDDPSKFIGCINEFLRIAEKHRIRVMFVLFDSCWHPEPKLGKQPAATPHLHNSGWVQAPGVAILKDPEKFKEMKDYVQGVLWSFRDDRRVLCWDLWNEPENNNASSYGKLDIPDKEKVVLPLVKQVFAWARAINPSQPLTAAPWIGDWSEEAKLGPLNRFLFDNSDIITFHRYENLPTTKKSVEALKRYDRPILCTEYMARPAGSTFEALLPYFQEQKVGAYCWGFVAGKTQTIYPWDSWQKKYDAEPKLWFHDILRGNGKPYDDKEVKQIKKITGKKIEVMLRFSVDELDPLKPEQNHVECIVRNGTDKAIEVPANYAGGWNSDLVLRAGMIYEPGTFGFYHGLILVYWAAEKKKETKLLNPGAETTVFKDELKAVLLLDGFEEKRLVPKEKRYYWDWQA